MQLLLFLCPVPPWGLDPVRMPPARGFLRPSPSRNGASALLAPECVEETTSISTAPACCGVAADKGASDGGETAARERFPGADRRTVSGFSFRSVGAPTLQGVSALPWPDAVLIFFAMCTCASCGGRMTVTKSWCQMTCGGILLYGRPLLESHF